MNELQNNAENGEILYKYTRNLTHSSIYQHILLSDGTLLISTGDIKVAGQNIKKILGKDSAVGEKTGKIIRENEEKLASLPHEFNHPEFSRVGHEEAFKFGKYEFSGKNILGRHWTKWTNEDLENLEAYGDTLGIEFIRGVAIITSINNEILETIISGDFNSTLKRVSNYRIS